MRHRRRGIAALIAGFPNARQAFGQKDAVTIKEAIGEAIRRERQAIKLTQTALAKKAGIARTTVVNLEAGHQGATWEAFFAIASVLKIPPWVLLERACQMVSFTEPCHTK